MNKHTIFGHFGPSDRAKLKVPSNELLTPLDLLESEQRLGYGIGRAIDDVINLGILPTEIGLDLLIIGTHVYAADTRISRETQSQDSWTREIRLVIPVSDPQRWALTTNVLRKMLDFLTGDRWTIEFRPRPRKFRKIIPNITPPLIKHPYDHILLFSGGLDSLIGAIDALELGKIPLLVSHASEGATSNAQDECFSVLKNYYKKLPFERLRVWMRFPEGLIKDVLSEQTTRGRSFLFFSIGCFAGSGFENGFNLNTAENGLMALNIPLDPLRLGALSTRTMHPFYIARWNELLSIVGLPGQISNPYKYNTKGEMIAKCKNQKTLRKITPISLSCSSPTKGRWQKRGIEHCGYCLPCIIRRAAIMSGLGSDPTTYTLKSLTTRALNAGQAEGQQVRSLQFAIQRIATNSKLAEILIYKSGPLLDESTDSHKALAAVYSRGMKEIAKLLKGVKTYSD